MSAGPASPDYPPSALPPGTRLGEFELLKVLGVGGFGIVYLAFDHALEREVAVKEYMPASLAGRTETMHVSLRSQSEADTFALGLRSFVNEAKMLAKFDHPSLLKVHRFWEANGTAYMAMPVISGRTIKDIRAGMAEPPDEAWLRGLLAPLLGAIERLHHDGVFHRDIAPDNIVIEADGRPVLLDFGAARRVISDKSQALTAILKPAYAPIEQYGEAGSVKQGPWTDLYALGATLHYMLLGHPPPPATARAIHDADAPLGSLAIAGCSQTFLQAIDWMLAPRPADRPQSVAALREVLDGRTLPPVRRMAAAVPESAWERTQVMPGASIAPTQPVSGDDPATVVVAPRPAAPPPEPTAVQTVAQTVPQASAAPRPPPPDVRAAPPPPPEVAAPPAPVPAPPQAAPASTAAAAPAAGPSRRLPLVVAGAALVAAVVAFALWPKSTSTGAAGDAAPAASVPAASTTASAASTPAVAASVPASAPAALAASAATSAPGPATVAQKPAPAAIKPAGRAAAPPAVKAVPAPVVRAPEPAPPPVAAPAPEPPKPVAQASAPAPRPSEPARVIGPTERCGKRVLLALWLCIEQECGKPELKQHPECVKWREDQERKANPTK